MTVIVCFLFIFSRKAVCSLLFQKQAVVSGRCGVDFLSSLRWTSL